MKHYKFVEFLSNLNVKPPCTNVKPPYWRLSGDGSGSTAHAVSCEKRVYDINTTTVYFFQKKYIHRLESVSARNNIHLSNKQKPEITNKNIGKIACQYDQPVW